VARVLVPSPARREAVEADRRWLAITVVIFTVSVGVVSVAAHIWDATGPHAQATVFFRQMKRAARWLLPDVRHH
jgi:hypothetical protein